MTSYERGINEALRAIWKAIEEAKTFLADPSLEPKEKRAWAKVLCDCLGVLNKLLERQGERVEDDDLTELLNFDKLPKKFRGWIGKRMKKILRIPESAWDRVVHELLTNGDYQLMVARHPTALLQLLKDPRVKETLIEDPVFFARTFMGWNPLPYQTALLRDKSKRITVRFPRQSGKSSTLAVKALHFCLTTKPKEGDWVVLLVAPGLRQSMILMDKIQSFLRRIPPRFRHFLIRRAQRTVITFRNGRKLVALPCSEDLIRGYTSDCIIADEAAFFKNDKHMFFSVLYPMLPTTDGTLIVSSTPWSKDSVFYEMCEGKLSHEFSHHRIDWRTPLKLGLYSKDFVSELHLLPKERFAREFECRFTDDADSFFPLELILNCTDDNLQYHPFNELLQGEFYIGIDLGKKQDYSVIAVTEERGEKLKLIHLHRFNLETPYSTVIGYTKTLCNNYKQIRRVLVDQTGLGEYIVEDMKASKIPVEGVTLTITKKEEILTYLKERMRKRTLIIPHDLKLIDEINAEKYELTKDGKIRFSHPPGTHDDMLWALALACYRKRKTPHGVLFPA